MSDTVILSSTSTVNSNQRASGSARAEERVSANGYDLSRDKVQPVNNRCYFGAWLGVAPDETEWNLRVPNTSRFLRESESLEEFRQKGRDFAALTGKGPGMVMMFEQWSNTWEYNPFPTTFCREVDSQGQVPLVTWEPSGLPFKPTDDKSTYLDEFNKQFSERKGEIYEYAKRWAEEARAYGKPFLLRPFHEMNLQDNYPWTAWMNGGKDGIGKFKEAWKNLYTLFKEVGANNATFVWCPNTRGYPIEKWNNVPDYFPGAEYVDWIGVDGYRDSADRIQRGSKYPLFDGVFGGSIKELRALADRYNKPLMICETSSIPDAGKADYVKQLFAAAREYGLNAVVWFNENKLGKGGGEQNWLIDAPVKGEVESIDESVKVLLDQAKTEAERKAIMKAMGIAEPKNPSAAPSNNPALEAFRNSGSDDYLLYHRTGITINTGGVNKETPQTVKIPPRKIKLDRSVQRINAYQSWGHYIFPMPGRAADIRMVLASRQEELSGYQHLKAVNNDSIDVLAEIGMQHQSAIRELSGILPSKRNYLKALAQMKDIYSTWETRDDGKRRANNAEAERLSNVLISLAKDEGYTGSFGNSVISLKWLFGLFNFLDPTRYSGRELLGYQASAHVTIADLHIGQADRAINENEYELVSREYAEAQRILSRDEFSRGTMSESLANSGSGLIEGKQFRKIWWMPAKALVHTAKWVDDAWLGGVVWDRDKDLKTSIRIGRAKLQTVDPATLSDGIKELEAIAYNTYGISPRLRIQAKVELAKALAKYAGMAQEIEEKDPVLYRLYMIRAKRSLVIARELFATEYAYKAGKLLEDLSKQIKE